MTLAQPAQALYSPDWQEEWDSADFGSEVAAKDEFNSIKNQTLDDVLASLQIAPQWMGIVPQNAGGFVSISQAAQAYAAN